MLKLYFVFKLLYACVYAFSPKGTVIDSVCGFYSLMPEASVIKEIGGKVALRCLDKREPQLLTGPIAYVPCSCFPNVQVCSIITTVLASESFPKLTSLLARDREVEETKHTHFIIM